MADPIVYFNRRFLPKREVAIAPEDRGFLLADGVYDVARVIRGVPFELDAHLNRLQRNARELLIPLDDLPHLRDACHRVLADNDLLDGEATVYMQVTRGVAPRTHAFPDPAPEPTVYMAGAPFTRREAWLQHGISALTVPDLRWARCDIKSISLLPNVMAVERAKRSGASEALFVRDGVVLEGGHSSFFAVFDGMLMTAPVSNYILPGITRALVLRLARQLEIATAEGPVFADRIGAADEAFITGTTTDITPVVTIDGHPIGSGQPGPLTRRLQSELIARLDGVSD